MSSGVTVNSQIGRPQELSKLATEAKAKLPVFRRVSLIACCQDGECRYLTAGSSSLIEVVGRVSGFLESD